MYIGGQNVVLCYLAICSTKTHTYIQRVQSIRAHTLAHTNVYVVDTDTVAVSYTHLTLPTMYCV